MSFIKKRRSKIEIKGALLALDGNADVRFSEAAVEGPLRLTCGDLEIEIQPSKDRNTLEVTVISDQSGPVVSVETRKKISRLTTNVSLSDPGSSLPFIKLNV